MKYDEIKDKLFSVDREAKKGGESMIFDYFYEEQSEAFSFYRTPQVFYTDERFRELSSDAKTLYGILLDRVSLSRKNGWRDDEGRVFVYMTVRLIETALGCAHQKACGLLAELEEFGLIERVKQHLCKPDRIYVKNFIQVWNSNARRYDNHTLIILILIILNRVIPILSYEDEEADVDERETYRKLLYRYLKLEYLYERYPYDRDTIDAFFELMLDVICSKRTTIRIAGDDKPTQVVRSQLLKLNMKHIEYILECMKNNTSKVRNIKQYMLAMIYNAPMTMNSYYEQMVNHDMAEGLIPESVYVYTSATCGKKKKKQYSTPFGVYTYRDVPVEVFPYGTKLCEENGYGFVIATAEKAICDTLYTCSPCANKRELRQLLFDDLRIDQTTFTSIDLNELAEVAGLYHTSNHRLLISLIKEIRRHE